MALYRITVKTPARSAGMVIDPGMSVEMATMVSNPVTNQQASEQLNSIFIATFGVDLKKMGCMNSGYLKVDRIK
ncbi:DUF6140 family protein [Bacteroides heparinolyticus]|uniref:DUF6140 family protein n=1 Tax=Prevotella heparinolytica TaxID=28113 RepID=UPI0028E804CF|nr:DUF6140 family protein [Bacteroides heparinolyticus]